MAILFVVVFHARDIIPGGGVYEHGYIAVDFFFVVTGFYIAKKILETNDINNIINPYLYTVKKAGRIFPTHLICILVLVVYCVVCDKMYLINGDVFFEIFFANRVGFTEYSLNGPDWFLSSVFFVTFIVYGLFYFGKKNNKINEIIFICNIVAIVALAVCLQKGGRWGLGVHSFLLCDFLDVGILRGFWGAMLGVNSYVLLHKIPDCKNKALSYAVEFLVFLLFLWVMIGKAPGKALDVFSSLLFCLIIISCYKVRGVISYISESSFVKWFSELELTIYLSHLFIMYNYEYICKLLGINGGTVSCLLIVIIWSVCILFLVRLFTGFYSRTLDRVIRNFSK